MKTGPQIICLGLMLMLLPQCFRQGEKREEGTELAIEESPGPLAFALNQPLTATNSNPVVLSWSPSTGSTSYIAQVSRQQDCGNPTINLDGILEPKIEASDLEEGQWYFCVTARDDQNITRPSDNNGLGFMVDRTAPTATVDSPPTLINQQTVATIGGDGVTSFKFKTGPKSDINCKESLHYSNFLPSTRNLTFDVSEKEEEWLLCLVGRDEAGNLQEFESATIHSFQTNGLGHYFNLSLPMVAGETTSVTDGVLKIKGTAQNGFTDPTGVRASLQEITLGLCLNSDKSAFDAPCPHYHNLNGTEWTFDVSTENLTAGNIYDLSIQISGNDGTPISAGYLKFHWHFGYHDVSGNEGTRIAHLTIDGAEHMILAGDAEGNLSGGVQKVSVPKEDDPPYNWFVAKNTKAGEFVWAKVFEGTIKDRVRSVATDSKNDILVAGVTQGTFDADGTTLTSLGSDSILLLKLGGTDGKVLWSRFITTAKDDDVAPVVIGENDHPVIFGRVCADANFGGGTVTIDRCALFVARYKTADGSLDWLKTYPVTGWPQAWGFRKSPSGDLYAGGNFSGTITIEGTAYQATGTDGLIMKLNKDGALQWVQVFTGAETQKILAVTLRQDNELVVSGTLEANATLGGKDLSSTTGVEASFIARLNGSDGTTLWSQIFANGTQDFDPLDVAIDDSGHTYFMGQIKGPATINNVTLDTADSNDLLWLKFNFSDGAYKEVRMIGGQGSSISGYPLGHSYGGEVYFPISYWHAPIIGNQKLPKHDHWTSTVLRYRP